MNHASESGPGPETAIASHRHNREEGLQMLALLCEFKRLVLIENLDHITVMLSEDRGWCDDHLNITIY